MNKYLLLRDNKQTGPHSLQEIREIGLKRYDLIWIEGKSAAWRYAGEIDEMKSFAPLVEEQPFDRFFKRPVREQQTKGSDAVRVDHEKKAKKYVSISMPSRNAQNLVQRVPLKKKQETIATSASVTSYAQQTQVQQAPTTTQHTELYFPSVGPLESTLINNRNSSTWLRENQQAILQYTALVLALASLLAIGVLIGMSMNSDPLKLPVTQSSVTSRLSSGSNRTSAKEDPTVITIPTSQNLPQEPVTEDLNVDKSDEDLSPGVNRKTGNVTQKATPAFTASSKVPEDSGNTSGKDRTVNVPVITVDETTKPEKPISLSPEVNARLNDYKINMFGGIDHIEVTVNNSSSFPLDLVVVEVDYIQSNKKVFKTETLQLVNIAPGASATATAPKTNRGIKLNSRITYITSSKAGISEHL
jgi:hypothetical protein